MTEMTFSEIVQTNHRLGEQLSDKKPVGIKILANISVNQLVPILSYSLRKQQLNANVKIGDYDNIIQECATIEKDEIPIIFWELCNIKESFVFEAEAKGEEFVNLYIEKVKTELHLVFDRLSHCGIVLFNKFSHILYSLNSVRPGIFERFVDEINSYLVKHLPTNFYLLDITKPIAKTGVELSMDQRGFYLSKTLYSVAFFKTYTKFILPLNLSVYGKAKKAIIFDCDNTLWKGVIGEDGIDGIALSDKDKNGIYFREIHLLAKNLSNKGVIVGLCSKNNPEDVDEVFEKREDSILKSTDFVIKKVNWNDKAENLREIAAELNIGVDSLVFVDDSAFELNLIRSKIAEIKTIDVPERLYEYPRLLDSYKDLFFSLNITEEDTQRAKMYQQNVIRRNELNTFSNIDDYLSSLNIQLQMIKKDKNIFERLIQLTQKTNQFNLTTKRYSNGEMQLFYDSSDYDVIGLEVRDKFGNSGITGLCIIHYNDTNADIDTLLLSCRVLGRNIEKVFITEILQVIKDRGCTKVSSCYIKTQKNVQVESFYNDMGFEKVLQLDQNDRYEFDLTVKPIVQNIDYINVQWASPNNNYVVR